jgi:hypothetical protein
VSWHTNDRQYTLGPTLKYTKTFYWSWIVHLWFSNLYLNEMWTKIICIKLLCFLIFFLHTIMLTSINFQCLFGKVNHIKILIILLGAMFLVFLCNEHLEVNLLVLNLSYIMLQKFLLELCCNSFISYIVYVYLYQSSLKYDLKNILIDYMYV